MTRPKDCGGRTSGGAGAFAAGGGVGGDAAVDGDGEAGGRGGRKFRRFWKFWKFWKFWNFWRVWRGGGVMKRVDLRDGRDLGDLGGEA